MHKFLKKWYRTLKETAQFNEPDSGFISNTFTEELFENL